MSFAKATSRLIACDLRRAVFELAAGGEGFRGRFFDAACSLRVSRRDVWDATGLVCTEARLDGDIARSRFGHGCFLILVLASSLWVAFLSFTASSFVCSRLF